MGTKLTREQYAKEGGPRCPVCLSRDIEGFDVDLDNGRVYQNARCNACRHEWTDIYELVGYDNLTAPEVHHAD